MQFAGGFGGTPLFFRLFDLLFTAGARSSEARLAVLVRVFGELFVLVGPGIFLGLFP